MILTVKAYMYRVIYTAGRISALGTGRAVKGVIAVEATVFTMVYDPVMLTFVAACGAVAVLR